MSVLYLTRRETFNASHRLFNEGWDEQKNLAVYGKCSNPRGHGHNFILEVTVQGEPHPEAGWIMDLKVMSSIIRSELISQLDHQHLNHDVPWLEGILPSIENLVQLFWKRLEPAMHPIKLYKIKLVETENNWIEYFG